MTQSNWILNCLLIDDDAGLIADVYRYDASVACFTVAKTAAAARELAAEYDYDAIFLNLGIADGMDLVGQLTADSFGSPLIAIASHGLDGRTLEHTLLLAELRGAAMSYPKPIEAAELVDAAAGFGKMSAGGAGSHGDGQASAA